MATHEAEQAAAKVARKRPVEVYLEIEVQLIGKQFSVLSFLGLQVRGPSLRRFQLASWSSFGSPLPTRRTVFAFSVFCSSCWLPASFPPSSLSLGVSTAWVLAGSAAAATCAFFLRVCWRLGHVAGTCLGGRQENASRIHAQATGVFWVVRGFCGRGSRKMRSFWAGVTREPDPFLFWPSFYRWETC